MLITQSVGGLMLNVFLILEMLNKRICHKMRSTYYIIKKIYVMVLKILHDKLSVYFFYLTAIS